MNIYEQRLRAVLEVVQRCQKDHRLSPAFTEIIGLVDPWPTEETSPVAHKPGDFARRLGIDPAAAPTGIVRTPTAAPAEPQTRTPGFDAATPTGRPRPSREWYGKMIAETLDDDFAIGAASAPSAEPMKMVAASAMPPLHGEPLCYGTVKTLEQARSAADAARREGLLGQFPAACVLAAVPPTSSDPQAITLTAKEAQALKSFIDEHYTHWINTNFRDPERSALEGKLGGALLHGSATAGVPVSREGLSNAS